MAKLFHAVDLDNTLAEGMVPHDPDKIGPPIRAMVTKVKGWIKKGDKVCIITARMCTTVHSPLRLRRTRRMIQQYCLEHIGVSIPVTAEKHPAITDYWDDRAHRIEKDTGKVIKGNRDWQNP